jgi:hypothetical protein
MGLTKQLAMKQVFRQFFDGFVVRMSRSDAYIDLKIWCKIECFKLPLAMHVHMHGACKLDTQCIPPCLHYVRNYYYGMSDTRKVIWFKTAGFVIPNCPLIWIEDVLLLKRIEMHQ